MAFPAVQATNESNVTTAGTTHVVNLPASIAAGDLLVIIFAHAVACTLNALAGWTELVDTNSANAEKILYRWADGTEGATVSFTSSASTKSAHVSYRISGAENPATRAPELSTVATGTSTTPNATTCTPTGGAKDYLWLTFAITAGEEADDDTWGGAAPSGFSNALYKTTAIAGTAATNCSLETSQQQLNASSLDAAAWSANAQSLAWRAWTMAIHPSSVLTVSPGLISSTMQVFAPTVARTVEPGLISSVMQAFTPTVSLTVAPGLVSSSMQLFTPSVATSGVYAPLISSAMQVFSPSVALTIFAPFISSAMQVFAPGVTEGITVSPGVIASPMQVFTPSVAVSGVYAPVISSAMQVFTPTVGISGVYVPLISSAMQTFAPSVSSTVAPGLISSTMTLFAPSVSSTVFPGLVSSPMQVFIPTVSSSSISVSPPLVSVTMAVYIPSVDVSRAPPPMYDPSIDRRRPMRRSSMASPRRAVKRKGVR